MANVLLITYMFPPAGGIGTPRALAYVRHLPRQGCRLSVLAPTKPALRDIDPELSKMVPENVKVHRAWNLELPMSLRDRLSKTTRPGANGTSTAADSAGKIGKSLRWLVHHLLFPDPQVVWLPFALGNACRIIKKEAIDTVVVNMPPFSLLRLGLALKRRFPHLKLITDFRDEWLGYYLQKIDRPSEEKVRRAHALEAEAVRESTYVTTVTDTWVQRLRQRYPEESPNKFLCIPNGYDPEMFRDLVPGRRSDRRMVITYFGTLHDNPIYSPANYLAAVESLPAGMHDQIETRFIGRIIGGAQGYLRQTTATVRVLGFMPKLQGIRLLQETDFVLLIATDPSSHAGKLFDYLGCGKPILALSPPGGEIDRLLQRTRTGWCANPWNQVAIQQMLISAYWRFKQGSAIISPDQEAVRAYEWPNIFCNFAAATGISPPETTDLRGQRCFHNL